jgi:hypothetical protein
MSHDAWAEVRDAVRPSVAAGQLLPHRQHAIALRHRVTTEDVARIYTEERDAYLQRGGKPAEPATPQSIADRAERIAAKAQDITEKTQDVAAVAQKAADAEPAAETVACDYCDEELPSRASLGQHLRTHPAAYKYPCDQCDYTGISPEALKSHRKKQRHLVSNQKNPAAATAGSAPQSPDVSAVAPDAPGAVETPSPPPRAPGRQPLDPSDLDLGALIQPVQMWLGCDDPIVARAADDAVRAIGQLHRAVETAEQRAELTAHRRRLLDELAQLDKQINQLQAGEAA